MIHWPEFVAYPYAFAISYDKSDQSRPAQLYRLVRGLPSLASLNLTQESLLIYLRWLTYLYTGPKWPSLTPQDMCDVIVQLRQLVAAGMDAMSSARPQFEPSYTAMSFTVYPSDLLDRVGLPRNYAREYLDYHHEHGEWPPEPLNSGNP